ncbi:LOW QUALITY PROTEIN: hypothetical protein PHPALM_28384 [Phytophthora palmivora]|uniref:Uncharacterized protein n=1 Tax=Phytophthora palmivora TaxID=4796 RepID=A0A2P4XAB0_9STRA|nr:LOW QUALITY PROTEIN: hypothetical protein PHPALM_28384 [Phytophthora palmivora]
MYHELTFLSDVPASNLTKALKTGKLSLTADQLKGSCSVIHLHPVSYEKALKAHKSGLDITRHEVKKGYKRAQGGSIWSKIWGRITSTFKIAKISDLLTQANNAAVTGSHEHLA